MGLFWYTFGLLTLLLAISAGASYWVLRVGDEELRVQENARQITAMMTLARASLAHNTSPSQRAAFIDALSSQEWMRLIPRHANDRVQPLDSGTRKQRLFVVLRQRLGAHTDIARSVNSQPGLWVSFAVDNDLWWLWQDRAGLGQGINGGTWLIWLALLAAGVLIGAALLARLINRPLDALAAAAQQVSQGDYDNSRLDETIRQAEVYTVNARFNRMAEQIARVERERAQMLAGISHDLRTPLARLRLDIEMSVPDETARDNMAADIDQVGATLNKFLDYARPVRGELSVVDLRRLILRCALPFARLEDMSVQVDVPKRLHVLVDEVELARVIANLLENAHRYGQTPDTGFTRVRIAATVREGWVRLRVRDHGEGVPAADIDQLTRPFFRSDTARQNVTGTGLGLAISARMIEAMGGKLRFVNAVSGGLQALIRLQLADGPGWAWEDDSAHPRR
ncbi:MAG: HAMP domain-containing protein [Burkholderiaceae bacterium]|nr:HAMP domain-containing protein [Burkholderiaceae bacterium]